MKTSRARILVASLIAVAALGISVHQASAKRLTAVLSNPNGNCGVINGNPVAAQATAHTTFGTTLCTVWATFGGGSATVDCNTASAVKTRARLGVLLSGGAGAFSQPAPFTAATSAFSTSWTAGTFTSAVVNNGSCVNQTLGAQSFGTN